MKIPANLQIYALGALAIAVLWIITRKPEALAKGVAGAVVGAATGLAVGAVKGIGEGVGIPDTDQARCDAAILAGHGWDVSLYCPAGQYIQYLAGSHPLQKLPGPFRIAAPGTIAIGGDSDPRVPGLGTKGVVTSGIPARDLVKRSRSPIKVLEPDPTNGNGTFADQSTATTYPW